MQLNELMLEWEKDSTIDDERLGEESTRTPNLHSKYINMLVAMKLKRSKIDAEFRLLRKNKFRYYRGELTRNELADLGWEQWQGVKPLKNEMDEFLEGDTDLVALKSKIDYLNVTVEFLESVMSAIRARDWQLKNGIEWKKFLVGM
jgi:hypothetical protein